MKPFVSLGMPVFNGIRYIEPALESLMAQDYERFEVVISDNASTDGTSELCERFAARYPRIRYHREPKNKGAIWNFNHVFEITNGELFGWTAHDDVWAPTYLSRCVAAFESYPDAVLVHPQFSVIGPSGEPVRDVVKCVLTADTSLTDRFREILLGHWSANAIYGLIRRAALDRTQRWKAFLGADYLLLGELATLGRFVEIPEILWSYRHTGSWDDGYYDRVRQSLHIHDRFLSKHAPWISIAWEMTKIALRAPQPRAVRLRLALEPTRWVVLDSRVFPLARTMMLSLLGPQRFEAARGVVRERRWYRRLRGIR
jgi:glycosyltransferase involved in cell wall biosynthesis